MENKHYFNIFKIISVLLFIYILLKIDVLGVLSLFYNSNILLIIAILVFNAILINFIRAYKWKIILETQKIKLAFFSAVQILFLTSFISNVLPGRIGELVRIYFIKKRGYSIVKSSVSIIIDRLQDISFIVIFSLIGMFFFSSLFLDQTMLIYTIFIVLFMMTSLVVFSDKFRNYFLNLIIRYLLPKRIKKFLKEHIKEFQNELKSITAFKFVYTALLSLLIWLVNFFMIYLIAQNMQIDISFFHVIIFSSLSSIVTSIPISFSGIGTRDALFIILFLNIGLTNEEAVAFSAIILMTYILFSLTGFLIWIFSFRDYKLNNFKVLNQEKGV